MAAERPAKYRQEIQQMMFVSGETAEPSAETTAMIEEIVRQQVIEMLTQATAIAGRRGVRSINTADLIFLIRHDKAKVSRLRTFLSWKDVRKNVKDSDDKGGVDGGDADFADDVGRLLFLFTPHSGFHAVFGLQNFRHLLYIALHFLVFHIRP